MKRNSLIVTIFFITAILLILAGIYLATLPSEDVGLEDIEHAPPRNESPIVSAKAEKDTPEMAASSNNVGYYVIVGSFQSEEQAKLRVGELKKITSDSIIVLPATSEGRIKISCGIYKTIEEAKGRLAKIRDDVTEGAWVLTVAK